MVLIGVSINTQGKLYKNYCLLNRVSHIKMCAAAEREKRQHFRCVAAFLICLPNYDNAEWLSRKVVSMNFLCRSAK